MYESSTASLMRIAKTATATTQARRAHVYEAAGRGQSRARAGTSDTCCAPLTQAEEGQGVIVAVMAPSAAPPQLLLRLVPFHKLAVCQLVQRAVHPHFGHQVKVLIVVLCGATARGVRLRQCSPRPELSPRAARPGRATRPNAGVRAHLRRRRTGGWRAHAHVRCSVRCRPPSLGRHPERPRRPYLGRLTVMRH